MLAYGHDLSRDSRRGTRTKGGTLLTLSTGLAERALYPVRTGGEIGPAYGPIEPPM